MAQSGLAHTLGLALESGEEFGMAMFPGEETPRWLNETSDSELTMEVSPWLTPYAQRIVIGNSKRYSLQHPAIEIPSVSTSHEEYIRGVSHVIDSCKGRNGKTVYSRVVCGEISQNKLPVVASRLFESHPDTLRFIYYTPATGVWLGATPELLLDFDKNSGTFHTMAFAGTRPKKKFVEWDGKNIRENRFVIEYITDRLKALGVTTEVAALETVAYGEIEHLCANISGQASTDDLEKIIDAINPTPALCGFPKNEAICDILHNELHERGCYGGFIGFSTPSRYVAFVNLRCMQFRDGKFCIFGGGGITAESDPETEYLETDAKTALLRKLTIELNDGHADS